MTPQVYDVGQHHLAPWEALDYTRQRDLLAKQDNDYGRARHQEQVLQAAYREIIASGILTNPVKLNAFIDTVSKAATVDTGGIPDVRLALRDAGDRRQRAGRPPGERRPLVRQAAATDDDIRGTDRDVTTRRIRPFISRHCIRVPFRCTYAR